MCDMRSPPAITRSDIVPRRRDSVPVAALAVGHNELRSSPSGWQEESPRRRLGAVGLLLLLWVGVAVASQAQGAGGSIAGRIRDRAGAALGNVSVTLMDTAHKLQRTSTTNALGGYQFAGLPPGTYEIQATVPGFCRTAVTASVVDGGTTPSDLVLKDCSDSDVLASAVAPRPPNPSGARPTQGVRPGAPAPTGAARPTIPASTPPEPATVAKVAPPAPPSPDKSELPHHEHMHRRPSAPAPGAAPEQTAIQPADKTATPLPKTKPAQANTHPGNPLPSATDSSGSTDAAEESWFAGLKQSRLDWDVPAVMVLNETRLITVRVYGYQDPSSAGDALPGSTGGSPLKVATQMSAELVSAGGDDMQVAPGEAAGVKYVPATGFTDWSWKVTPVHSAKLEKLKLTVRVVLDASHSRSFVTYSRPFEIAVVSAGSAKDYTEDHFWSMLKYWGPGGAGFLAAAGLFQWWRKRSQPGVAGVGPVARGGG